MIQIINSQSEEYKNSILLRYMVLMKPLGLKYTRSRLEDDKRGTHIIYKKDNKVIGVLILFQNSITEIQLKQFAINSEYQLKGIGHKLLQYVEEYSKLNNYSKIVLNARSNVLPFYLKHGFKIKGEEYISPRTHIPHFQMYKNLV